MADAITADSPPSFPWRRRGSVALFFGLFLFFLVSTSREQPWSDATPMWQLAESIMQRGAIDITTSWPPILPRGKDGKIYAAAPLVQGLVQVPAAAIRTKLIERWPKSPDLPGLSWPLLSHVAPAALGALTCVLFFGICRRLRVSVGAAGLATAALAFGTTIWVYARSPYSEILQAAAFTGFLGALLDAGRVPRLTTALRLGAWAGLLVNTKLVYLPAVMGGAVALTLALRHRPRELAKMFAIAALALLPFVLMIAWYNHARWGSFLATGYGSKDANAAVTQEPLLFGLWGLLFSPGKSLFLYSPPLVLALVAFPRAWRRTRALMIALVATVAPVVAVNGTLTFWSGDYAWGPRYLVFAVPALLIPAALLIDDLRTAARRWWRPLAIAATAGVLLAGNFVQVLGNAFFWDHYIRVQREARGRWLGTANRSGTPFPDFGGVCGACFEDIHPMLWLPPFTPIEGHWWLLKHAPFKHEWTIAEADAPWHRYTSLRLNVLWSYRAARLDWWFLDFGLNHKKVGIPLLVLMGLGALGGGRAFWRELTRARRVGSARMDAPFDTRADQYTERLRRGQAVWWKRLLDVQRPYRWNLRRMKLGFVLDVGCGLGRNLVNLGGRGAGVGVDHNGTSVAEARSRDLEAYLPHEFEASPHAQAGRFDAMLIAHVLEHVPAAQAEALIRTYLPYVRGGGRIVMITPQEAGYRSDPTHVEFLDLDALERLARALGLQVRERFSFPFPRPAGRVFRYNEFVLVAQKPAEPT